jgi:hypothetical protein
VGATSRRGCRRNCASRKLEAIGIAGGIAHSSTTSSARYSATGLALQDAGPDGAAGASIEGTQGRLCAREVIRQIWRSAATSRSNGRIDLCAMVEASGDAVPDRPGGGR